MRVESVAAWEAGSVEAPCGGEGWAQFGGDGFPPPVDPFARSDEGPEAPAPAAAPDEAELFQGREFLSFWPSAERDSAASSSHAQPPLAEESRNVLALASDSSKRPSGSPAPSFCTAGRSAVAEPASEPLNLAEGVRSLQLEPFGSEQERSAAELASNLLSAMSGMAPDLIANIVNANISPLHLPQAPAPPAPPAPPSPPPAAAGAPPPAGDAAGDDATTDS